MEQSLYMLIYIFMIILLKYVIFSAASIILLSSYLVSLVYSVAEGYILPATL